MVVAAIMNKIIGVIYILAGIVLMVLAIILLQLIWSLLPVLESFAGIAVPVEYFYVVAVILLLPWIFFIIHGVAHYLIGRQVG